MATVEGLTIHYGQFQASKVYTRLVTPPPPPEPPTVYVRKMEEKRFRRQRRHSLVIDAYENNCDVAVVVSNDSDLAMRLNVVTQRLGRFAVLVNPTTTIPTTSCANSSGRRPLSAACVPVC